VLVANEGIILSVTRRFVLLICALGLACACKRAPENKEAIQAGVVEHLKKAGTLDLNQLDIAVMDVKYEGNEAVATVSFKPKTAPQQGMTMPYTLERRGDKWQVKGRSSGGHGGGMGSGMGSGAAAGAPDSGAAGQMPPGHPSVGGAAKGGGDLPAGHPPVNAPAPAPQKK
jgi:hypothetical protein